MGFIRENKSHPPKVRSINKSREIVIINIIIIYIILKHPCKDILQASCRISVWGCCKIIWIIIRIVRIYIQHLRDRHIFTFVAGTWWVLSRCLFYYQLWVVRRNTFVKVSLKNIFKYSKAYILKLFGNWVFPWKKERSNK